MRFAICLLFALGASAVTASAAAAADSSWFGWGSGAKQPAAPAKKTAQPSSPGVVSKMTDAPKRFVTSTKKVLGPKTTTSNQRGTKAVPQTVKNPKAQKQGFFKSMLAPDPPAPPQTINDWMKLKQIHP